MSDCAAETTAQKKNKDCVRRSTAARRRRRNSEDIYRAIFVACLRSGNHLPIYVHQSDQSISTDIRLTVPGFIFAVQCRRPESGANKQRRYDLCQFSAAAVDGERCADCADAGDKNCVMLCAFNRAARFRTNKYDSNFMPFSVYTKIETLGERKPPTFNSFNLRSASMHNFGPSLSPRRGAFIYTALFHRIMIAVLTKENKNDCQNNSFIEKATKYLLRMSLKSVHSTRMCLTGAPSRVCRSGSCHAPFFPQKLTPTCELLDDGARAKCNVICSTAANAMAITAI